MTDAPRWSPTEASPPPSTSGALRVLGRGILRTGLSLAAFLALPGAGAGEIPGPEAPALSHLDALADPQAPAMDAPVILITGSTSGLGREVALRLAATGAHVIIHGRNRDRGMEVVQAIQDEGTGSARFYAADLASLEETRAFAETILRDYDRLDVLVNNAGILSGGAGGDRALSADGHELVFQVNYLSTFLLTRKLLPLVQASAPSRIVNVSSVAQRPIDFDDVMLERDYSDGRAYAQSKLAQILFTFDLAEELEETGVTVNALHPATLMDTGMVLDAGIEPRSSVDEGADALMQAITAPELGTGRYFRGLEPEEAHAQAYDRDARERLRRLSRELTGVH